MGYKVSETIKTSTQLTWYEVDRHRRAPPPRSADGRQRHHDVGGLVHALRPAGRRIARPPDGGRRLDADLHGRAHLASKPASTKTITENWTTDAVNETVTVPAGTFSALKITRTNTADGTAKSQWFVPGVGKIRESNTTGHLEELTSYMIPTTNGGA